MSTTARTWTKIVGWLVALAGVIMLVAGIVAWSVVGGELSSQKINVAAQGAKENIANGPFDALGQVNLIKTHTAEQMKTWGYPEGTTYAQVPRPDAAELATCRAQAATDGADALSAQCKQDIQNDSARTYLDNSNFKQASLYTSVMAFGVSFLVIGVGLVLLLIASAALVATSRKGAAKATKTDSTAGDKVSVTV